MKLPNWMTNFVNIKQGIEQKPSPKVDYNSGEYETYIDPKCGCTKYRKKVKSNKIEQDANVDISTNSDDKISSETEIENKLLQVSDSNSKSDKTIKRSKGKNKKS